VVGDVGEGKPLDGTPLLRIEDLRNHELIMVNAVLPPWTASGQIGTR
jgi:hypothetical protein